MRSGHSFKLLVLFVENKNLGGERTASWSSAALWSEACCADACPVANHDLFDNAHVAVLILMSDKPREQDHELIVSEWADWTYRWVSAEAARFHRFISYVACRYASSETLANRKAAVR